MQLAVIEVLYQKQDTERKIDQQDFSDNNELVDLDANHNRHRGNHCDVTEVSCSPVIKKVRKLLVIFKRPPRKKRYLANKSARKSARLDGTVFCQCLNAPIY